MQNTFGKGIESLIPKKGAQEPVDIKQEPIFYIDIDRIKSNPYQPRKNFDQDGLRALADSIKEHGILQPLLVSRMPKDSGGPTEYQLVAGERRLLAAKMTGLSQVPVIVREPTEQEKLEVALIENIQREDLNALEKAQAYKRLQDEFKFLQKDIAKLVGKSREAVANTLRLLDLPLEIKEGLKDEKISEGHARAILAVQDQQKQQNVFTAIVRDGLSVRDAESLAQKLNIWQPARRQISAASKEVKDLEGKIREIIGIKNLRLRIESGLPKLTIFFNSKKELESLLKKF